MPSKIQRDRILANSLARGSIAAASAAAVAEEAAAAAVQEGAFDDYANDAAAAAGGVAVGELYRGPSGLRARLV